MGTQQWGELVFDITRFLTAILFSLALVLPTFMITFIVSDYALAFILTCIAPRILTCIARFTTLMRLLCGLCRGHVATCQQNKSRKNSEM